MASQSDRDCSDAAGEVSSMYSTPKASKAFAIAILVLVSKKALANCSPSIEFSWEFMPKVVTTTNLEGCFR
jgi:hypothetical protein